MADWRTDSTLILPSGDALDVGSVVAAARRPVLSDHGEIVFHRNGNLPALGPIEGPWVIYEKRSRFGKIDMDCGISFDGDRPFVHFHDSEGLEFGTPFDCLADLIVKNFYGLYKKAAVYRPPRSKLRYALKTHQITRFL